MIIKEIECEPARHKFKRKTLVKKDGKYYVVMTAGMLESYSDRDVIVPIGHNRFYETSIFSANEQGIMTCALEVYFEGMPEKWSIAEPNQDAEAEEMHRSFVEFLAGTWNN